jgi:hypothetical protein
MRHSVKSLHKLGAKSCTIQGQGQSRPVQLTTSFLQKEVADAETRACKKANNAVANRPNIMRRTVPISQIVQTAIDKPSAIAGAHSSTVWMAGMSEKIIKVRLLAYSERTQGASQPGTCKASIVPAPPAKVPACAIVQAAIAAKLGKTLALCSVYRMLKAMLTHQYTYAYGAVSPMDGKFDSLVLPQVNTECMQLFITEIARHRGVRSSASKPQLHDDHVHQGRHPGSPRLNLKVRRLSVQWVALSVPIP